MYVAITVLLTVILPLAFVAVEAATTPAPDILALVGRWFMFWGAGVRLLLAGITQTLRPQVTAGILGLANPKSDKVVSELGSANLVMGLLGVATLFVPQWLGAAALTGGLYLLLAGAKHIANAGRNVRETTAMVTDLVVAAAAVAFLAGQVL